jgi:uncharacterized membrane protein
MGMTNREITAQARSMLKGSWMLPILASGIYVSIIALLNCIPLLGWAGALVITGPLSLGYCMAYLAFVRTKDMKLSGIFDGFRQFANAFLAYLLKTVFIILWTLLLIVPGIIASLSYAMTFFILADNPGMEGLSAISRSKELMRGRKWQLFCLGCRFIGWGLLGILSLGIGFVWIIPYFQTSATIFYEDLLSETGVAIPLSLSGDPITPSDGTTPGFPPPRS